MESLGTGWLVFISSSALLLLLIMLGLWANRADWGGFIPNVIDGLLRLFCKYYHRLHYEQVKLPEHGGAIIACNHISGLDPVLLVAACRRPIHFIIASDEYHRYGLNWLFRLGGCIPIDRQGGRIDGAFRSALRALEEGKVIALFPQGRIHAGKEPPPRLKRGVQRLAQLSGLPVYPFHVSGVKGKGYVIRSVVFPGKPRIESFDPVDCATMTDQDCLHTLAERMKVTHH